MRAAQTPCRSARPTRNAPTTPSRGRIDPTRPGPAAHLARHPKSKRLSVGLILLIPILHRFSVYKMLVYGAMISAISLFIMALPIYGDFAFTAPGFGELVWNYTYVISVTALVVLTIGEVIWSPRLTEYTAAIAPPGQEGTYLGLSMVPYFAAKTLVSLASGFMLAKWVTEPPEDDPLSLRRQLEAGEISFWDGPSGMWMMLAIIAFAGPLIALLLRGWFTKGAHFERGEGRS